MARVKTAIWAVSRASRKGGQVQPLRRGPQPTMGGRRPSVVLRPVHHPRSTQVGVASDHNKLAKVSAVEAFQDELGGFKVGRDFVSFRSPKKCPAVEMLRMSLISLISHDPDLNDADGFVRGYSSSSVSALYPTLG